MAKNREPVKPVESESDSGEEEEASSGSEESDSEPELTQITEKPSSKPPQQQQQPPSSDEEESGSESETDSDEPDPKVKPLATKPMDEPSKPTTAAARKPSSKSSAASSEIVTPAKSTAASKRPAESKETDGNEAKKSKKNPGPESSEKKPGEDSKKQLFQRLWSEDDEIEVLKGMIDYASTKKKDPVANLNAFHDFIKKNLHVDVTRVQLQDKIRRLKKKYLNNKGKEKEGKDRTFTNAHEGKTYDLSKKIWGTENGVEKAVVASPSPKANGSSVVRKSAIKKGASTSVVEKTENKDVKSGSVEVVDSDKEMALASPIVNASGVFVDERVMRIGMDLFETGKGLEGEKEWKRLRRVEMEAYQMQVDVKAAQTKLVMDYMKSRDQ